MNRLLAKIPALLLTLIVGLIASSSAFATATIVIQNNDAPGVGFNDPTVVAQVDGNTGTTVGAQRLIAFQFAADIWGATLVSGPTIVIRASWEALDCGNSSGILGSSGATSLRGNFANAPFPGTWYGVALANALAGSDLNGATAEISARFNFNVGTTGCLQNSHWFYGLNKNDPVPSGSIDLVTVLLHEFAHGLGFQSFTDEETGAQAGTAPGFPSIFDKFLLDNTTGKMWPDMTNAERVASAINNGNLVWNGPQVTSDASPPVLTSGKDSLGHPLMFAPATVKPGSSVSHWDTLATPNQLMEPNISGNLGHGVTVADSPADLTFSLLRDVGWCAGCPQPPPPSPTPTPSPPPNDNFANAQVISGCSGSVTGTNVAATKEAGELNNPDSPGSTRSVWYQWQSPGSGNVTFTTAGSSYDTILAIYTGTSVNALTLIGSNDDVGNDPPGGPHDTSSSVTFVASAGIVYRIAVDGFNNNGSLGDTGNITLNWTAQSPCSVGPPTVQLAAPSYNVSEGAPFLDITVTRSSSAGASTVDYSTNDFMAVRCDTVPAGASAKCDYVTSGGTLRFADTESSKTIRLSIIDDAFVEGNETLSISLSIPTGATLGSPASTTITILDNDSDPNAANPYLNNAFFVRQQYLDFLLREPDTAGYDSWLATLNGCNPGQGGLGSPPGCDRVEVSSGFFRSTEFGEKGYWVYRFYQGALGRRPQFAEFTSEMRRLSGLMTDAEQETRRADFIARFMQLPEFTGIYAGITDAAHASEFITKLEQEAGVTLPASAQTDPGQPPQYGRAQLIGLMQNGTLTPAQTLRAFIEQKVVWDTYFYRAFVAMQYFGYLRRDPDQAGYDDWVRVLTFGDAPTGIQPGDYRHLIFGFVYSVEYRERFGKQ